MRAVRPGALKKRGIMGMNMRNGHYIGRYNNRKLYPLVDDKLKTKSIALEAGITVPDLIAEMDSNYQLKHLDSYLEGHNGFAVKPAKGSGGKGILVILKREGDQFFKPSGEAVSMKDMKRHCANILAGLYSLGGKPDTAIIETLINPDRVFDDFSYEGVPDIRVIIFKGFPVMAMMRLSTAESDGKANLHQGAVGVGLDIGTGRALRAVQHGKIIEEHPDTGVPLSTLAVPQWDTLLTLASGCYEMTGLGYLGADMVLDKDKGPLLLELNARPGLAIQVANGAGLLDRLRYVENLGEREYSVEERIRICSEFDF
ncbi:MAG: alpha-L-glutamate ligase-like protein [Spirochaetales bacterium]|nr:alpha-L-glutamate ligase-like protein [Spirochaetales bacterium]